jgi:8-oxo-dGTP pyrophosphatase MutT (NUDIX family)
MDIKVMRESFARGVAQWFDMEFMPMGKLVLGVSFVPIHVYGVGDAKLVGKPCVVLGKERGGVYGGQLNFIGGKIEDQNMQYKGADVAKVLFDEVYEEFHMALTPALFGNMLLKVFPAPFGDGLSLVFVVHLKGVSRGVWDKEHRERLKSNASWKFVEFDCIEHVPLDDLMVREDVSCYVDQFAPGVRLAAQKLKSNKGVRHGEFLTAKVRNNKVIVE